MTTTTFRGFPKGTLDFLAGLSTNNTKKWFDAHRDDYEQFYVEAAKAFVTAVAPGLSKIIPDIEAEPRINGSISRINRDIRFSKDKRPYKDHLDLRFWQGDRKTAPSCLFLRLTPDELIVGAGFHGGDSKQVKTFRQAVDDRTSGAALAKLAPKLRKQGYELGGKYYKRTPRDFADDGPAAEFLLHNALFSVHETKAKAARARDVVGNCLDHWRTLAPLHRWLTDYVSG